MVFPELDAHSGSLHPEEGIRFGGSGRVGKISALDMVLKVCDRRDRDAGASVAGLIGVVRSDVVVENVGW